MPLRVSRPVTVPLFFLLLSAQILPAAEPLELVVDCSHRLGLIRPIHGVNMGPVEDGGLLDLSAYHRQAGFPLTRLHDVHWPNPDVVDMHVVFPDPHADSERPESYDFAATDDYVRATLATGTKLVYRLGESIEHGQRKRHVHPPRDAEKWAAACIGVVRHYNEGWGGGPRHDIQYWEIWNEPDNRPAMWTGTDEDYFRLYAAASKAIKKRWPNLKVGGPAVGNTGELTGGTLRPSPFLAGFLDRCRRDGLPLDFFSWHVYSNNPREVADRARAVRALLDLYGFRQTESHLNEWNYLPDNDWTPVGRGGQGAARQRFYDRLGGAEGAAFTAATLLCLQDAPLDAACYFNAGSNSFGLFNPHGVPKKTFHAFRAFRMLLDTPNRVRVSGPDLAACAGLNDAGDALTLVVSHCGERATTARVKLAGLPWRGASTATTWLLDDAHDLAEMAVDAVKDGSIERTMSAHSVWVVRVKPAKPD